MASIGSVGSHSSSPLSSPPPSPESAPRPSTVTPSAEENTQKQKQSAAPPSAAGREMAERLHSQYRDQGTERTGENLPPTTNQRRRTDSTGEAANSSAPSPGHSRLEQLPLEVLRNVLDHMKDRDDVRSASLTSKTMRWRIFYDLLALKLIDRAKNAWRKKDIASELEEVFAAASNSTNRLTSEQRLAIIKSVDEEFLTGSFDEGNAELVTLVKFVTRKSATAVVEVVKGLRPEHKGEGLYYASKVLKAELGDYKIKLFDDLTDIAMSLKSDKDKSYGMYLLHDIDIIPKSDRAERFDRFAPLWETIVSEQEKAKNVMAISSAIRKLPLLEMNERFVKYAEATKSIQNDVAKATAVSALTICISELPENDKRKAFDTLVSIVGSINDAEAKAPAVKALSAVIDQLPEHERLAARASLPT